MSLHNTRIRYKKVHIHVHVHPIYLVSSPFAPKGRSDKNFLSQSVDQLTSVRSTFCEQQFYISFRSLYVTAMQLKQYT